MSNDYDTGIHDAGRLKELQRLPLERKIMITQTRILEWYFHYGGSVYLSFSGGKDSRVLLDLVRRTCPDIPAVFVDTGLEYPEIRKFAQSFENVVTIYPLWGKAGKRNGHLHTDRLSFRDVVSVYGYPIIGKEVSECIGQARISTANGKYAYRMRRLNGDVKSPGSQMDFSKWKPLYYLPFRISAQCCSAMKKRPANRYARQEHRYAITGQLASESRLRRQQWIRNGCNGFYMKKPISNPMSFWTEQDVLEYIVRYNVPICSVYGEVVRDEKNQKFHCTGCDRTGCIFCAYGFHRERGETRFQRLMHTHPKQYEYCIGGGQWVENPKYDALLTDKECWNPRQIWVPSKSGLGMGRIFDWCNEIYGKDFMRYE